MVDSRILRMINSYHELYENTSLVLREATIEVYKLEKDCNAYTRLLDVARNNFEMYTMVLSELYKLSEELE